MNRPPLSCCDFLYAYRLVAIAEEQATVVASGQIGQYWPKGPKNARIEDKFKVKKEVKTSAALSNQVVKGRENASSFHTSLDVVVGSNCTSMPCDNAKFRHVENVYYPQYAQLYGPYDIAVLQLDTPVMEQGVWPICLPSKQDHLSHGERPHVAGWGDDPSRRSDVTLQKLIYNGDGIHASNGMYYIGGDYRAVCGGDSGAGLYRVNKSRATILGVLSGGTTCEVVRQYKRTSNDTYVPVSDMLWWITPILGEHFNECNPEGTLNDYLVVSSFVREDSLPQSADDTRQRESKSRLLRWETDQYQKTRFTSLITPGRKNTGASDNLSGAKLHYLRINSKE
ncbi:trypsin [Cooperia oncophora]